VAHTCNPSYSGEEIRRMPVQSQPRKIVSKTPISQKNQSQKRAGGVTQGVGPEYKPQYHKKINKVRSNFLCIIKKDD
jgi:hypothetical protein